MANEPAAGQVTPKPGEGEKPAGEKPAGEQKPNEGDPNKPALGADGKPVEKKPDDKGGAADDTIVEPVAPDAYDLALPEKDSPFETADLTLYIERAKRLGLTQKQAQTLVNTEAADITAANTQLIADLKADKELGGDKLDASLAMAKQGRDAVLQGLPEDERNTILGWLSDPKLKIGNHKALVRMFANIGKLLQEDKPATNTGSRGESRDAASVLWPDKK
jgi:hypothetical protein